MDTALGSAVERHRPGWQPLWGPPWTMRALTIVLTYLDYAEPYATSGRYVGDHHDQCHDDPLSSDQRRTVDRLYSSLYRNRAVYAVFRAVLAYTSDDHRPGWLAEATQQYSLYSAIQLYSIQHLHSPSGVYRLDYSV